MNFHPRDEVNRRAKACGFDKTACPIQEGDSIGNGARHSRLFDAAPRQRADQVDEKGFSAAVTRAGHDLQ